MNLENNREGRKRNDLKIIQMSDVQSEQVRWLWQPYKEICDYFKRTKGAIASRLVRMEKIQDRDSWK